MVKLGRALEGMVCLSSQSFNSVYRGEVLMGDQSITVGFIKDLDRRQLGNEILFSIVARHLGLPVPDFALVVVAKDVCDQFRSFPTPDGKGHFAFCSFDAKGSTIAQILANDPSSVQTVVAQLKASSILGGLYGLDTWIANVDRHTNNVILRGNGDIFLIDHGHILSGPSWIADDLKHDASYPNRLSSWLTPVLDKGEKDAAMADIQLLQQRIEAADISKFVATALGMELYGEQDVKAVVAFLQARIPFIPNLNAAELGTV